MFFFFNDTATTEIYTLSLHDALPIYLLRRRHQQRAEADRGRVVLLGRVDDRRDRDLLAEVDDGVAVVGQEDRKSTRLNSSHANISYAVFCLKKKTQK